MARASDLQLSVLVEKTRRLETALAELATDLHRISTTEQVRANGKPALASILDEYRQGSFETTVLRPAEER